MVSSRRPIPGVSFLTAQVPNPYFIDNFAFLRTTDPVLYQRLASNPTFSSATIQRNRLLRPFGFMTGLAGGLLFSNLPLGASKSHSLEVQVNRRFSNGLTGFLSFNVTPGNNCDYFVKSNANWIKVQGADTRSGNSTVTFRVTVNPTVTRTGTITVGDQTVTIRQSRS